MQKMQECRKSRFPTIILASVIFLLINQLHYLDTDRSNVLAAEIKPLIITDDRITDDRDSYNLGHFLYIIEDRQGQLKMDNLTGEQTKDSIYHNFFNNINYYGLTARPGTELTPSFGFTESAYWLVFTIENHSNHKEWYLEIGYPLINYLDLWYYEDGRLQHRQAGSMLPFQARDIMDRNVIFPLNLDIRENNTYYLRVESQSTMVLPLTLWHPPAHTYKSQSENFAYGLYYGIMLIMAFYHLIMVFNIRSKQYIFYSLFVFSFVIFQFTWNGLAYQYLWPDSPAWNRQAFSIFFVISIIWLIYLSKDFLQVKEHSPGWYQAINVFTGFTYVILFLTIVLPYKEVRFFANLPILSSLFLIIVAARSYKKGQPPEKYYLTGLLFIFTGGILSVLVTSSLITVHPWYFDLIQILFAMVAVVFAMALSSRVNITNKEKEQSQRDNLEMQKALLEKQQQWRKEMEAEVTKRTDELNELTAQLSATREKLQETDARKTEILYVVTHELRTPLTSILGFSHLVNRKYQSVLMPALLQQSDKKIDRATEQIRVNINIIEEEGQRLTNLITNFLDLSRLEEGTISLNYNSIRIEDLVAKSYNSVRSLVKEKNLTFATDLEPGLPEVTGDGEKLMQVMINLLSNAIKFTSAGTITCRAFRDREQVTVSITDTGSGLTEEEQKTVFEKFQQAGNQGAGIPKGTGLGLPICKQIIELHKGLIWVESTPGQGSTFSFSLPP